MKINIPSITGRAEGTGILPGFDEFVAEQMSALQSKNVLEKAVKNPQWAGLVQIEDENLAELDLLRRLKVTQNGELVKVESSDGDPRMATAAVNTVMSAYKEQYVLVDPETSDPVIVSLKTEDKQLELARNAAKKSLDDLVAKLGTDQLDAECASIQDQVTTLEKSIQTLRREIAVAAIELKRPPLEGISDEYLMLIDPTLTLLIDKLHEAQLRLTLVEKGSNSSSPIRLKEAQEDVADIKELLQGRLDQIHDLADHGIMIPGLPKRTTQRDVDDKQAELDLLVPEAVAARKQWVSTNQQNIDLKALKEQLAEVQKKLNDNQQHIEEERLNNPNPRRLEVLSEGEYPLAPDKDSRPKLAAVGSLGGLFMATMLVGLMGMMNRKLRVPHDLHVRMEAKTVLGIIPSLEEGPDFSQRAALASECVHRSRTMLEIWARGNKKMVIGVTSPTHGSGNTSVAMSLGVSFAAAGLKTLLVDCDFVTTGLTPRLQTHVRRELSTVLKREGLISETQLNHAMRVAAAETVNGALGSRSIGDVCVDLGYITQAELDAAVAVQMKESIGILDALAGEDLRSCVGKTGIRNLSLLPRANATPAHAAKLSSQSLRAVLDEAREHYDTIIIDTSAMLSGLEASIVASAVDGMVVTVARGVRNARNCKKRFRG